MDLALQILFDLLVVSELAEVRTEMWVRTASSRGKTSSLRLDPFSAAPPPPGARCVHELLHFFYSVNCLQENT